MNNPASNIDLARQCLSGVASRYGIPGFNMDDGGRAVLDFDGRPVCLFADESGPWLQAQAVVSYLEPEDAGFEDTLESLLSANLFADKLGDAWFAWSREEGAVVLNKRIRLVDPGAIDEPLDDFLSLCETTVEGGGLPAQS